MKKKKLIRIKILKQRIQERNGKYGEKEGKQEKD